MYFPLIRAVGDYIIGSLLLIGPWLFGFSAHSTATTTTMSFGAIMIVVSLFTDYRPALVHGISPTLRIVLDAAFAGLLIASPWIFSFADTTWIPHLVIGIVEASRSCARLLEFGALKLMSSADSNNRKHVTKSSPRRRPPSRGD